MEGRKTLSEINTGNGYTIRTELISDYGDPFEMESAYNPQGDYIGNLDMAKRLCEDRGIAPVKSAPDHGVCSIGFCEKEQKWYGWSHRAIYGFGIGSKCEKGDCHYVADTPEGLIEDRANFFADISEECAQEKRDECQILPDRSGIRILHTPINLPMASSLEEVIDSLDDPSTLPTETIFKDAWSIQKCGRGEWTAETLEDAKQMAIDFAEGVA
jgi:hypothetical protein